MAETFHGSLLFYRWPPGNDERPEIPWSEAPEACRSFLGDAVVAKYAGIWHGNDGRRESFPWSPEKRTAIAVVHLKDLSCADATALKRAFARVSHPNGLEGEDAMRQFLGLELGPGRPTESPWITEIFSAPLSPERDEFVEWTQTVLEKVWKPKERDFLRKWSSHVAVTDSAPGAGKITIIIAICLGILHSKTQCRVFVAQPNKELCSRLVATLRRIAAKFGIPPAISRVGVNEASAHPVTQECSSTETVSLLTLLLGDNENALQQVRSDRPSFR